MMRQASLAEARRWIGTPYQHQASCRGAGTDCLGLIRGIWRELYGTEPEAIPAYQADWRSGAEGEVLQAAARRHLFEIEPDTALPGDVLLFRPDREGPIRHCAVLSAPRRIIHAYWGRSVCETALTGWWQRRLAGAFVFPPKEACDG